MNSDKWEDDRSFLDKTRAFLGSAWNRGFAYGVSLIHPYTIGRAFMAEFRGIGFVFSRMFTYLSADDKSRLRDTNALQHHRETQRRRWTVGLIILADLLILLIATFRVHKTGLLRYDVDATRLWIVWVLAHIVIFFLIGRNGQIMQRVQTVRLIGDYLYRQVIDDMTLTEAAKKKEAFTRITQPVARLDTGKGQTVTVQVHDLGNPENVFKHPKTLAHKLRHDVNEVFIYRVKGDASQIRLVILDSDPWDAPPSSQPLAVHPREVNLWKEAVNLAVTPEGRSWTKTLLEAGDGGGIIIAGKPRAGKTVFLKSLLIPIMFDPRANIRMIDGKAVDFEPLRPLAKSFVGEDKMPDKVLIDLAIAVLDELLEEIERRKTLLKAAGLVNLNEEFCNEHDIRSEWLFVDELAVFLQDMKPDLPKEVKAFRTKMGRLIRLGPAFGIFAILATQRPSEITIPEEWKGMISWKMSFYVATQPSSRAALGAAGPENRADWLDPNQKGVFIALGEGQLRGHNVTVDEFKSAVQYAITLRAGHSRDPEKMSEAGASEFGYPEPVATILDLFEAEMTDQLPTWAILIGLEEAGQEYDARSLAAALSPWEITPVNVGKKREKGYRLNQFRVVKPTPGVNARRPLPPAPRADESGAGADDVSGNPAGLSGFEPPARGTGSNDDPMTWAADSEPDETDWDEDE
jgi:hypothetical protein